MCLNPIRIGALKSRWEAREEGGVMGRFIVALSALLVAAVAVAASAHAETFPSRSIRIIVPYAPGGSIDLTARVIAKNLQDRVGQSVIVENKPGANAAIGIDDLTRSEPDGYTLILLRDYSGYCF
jgi:tripartite-type tricarboxylate transporter receptor subunit TctC